MMANKTKLNPYIGPRPFERLVEDSNRFFGRDLETEEIISLVFAHPLLLIYASSGAGKTSLLNAKVIPTLEERGFEVLRVIRLVGVTPEGIDVHSIRNFYTFNTLMNLRPESDPHILVDSSLSAFLEELPRRLDTDSQPVPRVIVFDQFEEMFTTYWQHWREQQEQFFRQINESLVRDGLLRVLFVIREDYLAQLDPVAHLLPERLRTRFRLERLREGPALEAVKGPIRNSGRSFGEDVAEKLIDDLLKMRVETLAGETLEVKGEFVEPVQLQVVCQNLWRDLTPDVTEIREAHLQHFGSVDRALEGYYDHAIGTAVEQTGVEEYRLRNWCESSLITSTGTKSMVHRGSENTNGMMNKVVDILEELHLVRADRRAGARWYELTHDRFIEPIRSSNERWQYQQALQTEREIQPKREVGSERDQTYRLAVLGRMFREKHQYETAVWWFSRYIEQFPSDAYGYAERAGTYWYWGQYQKAIEDFTRELELDADSVHAYSGRGQVLAEFGEYEKAITDLRKALELEPSETSVHAYARNGLALAYSGLGRYQEALNQFEVSMRIRPDNAWAYYNRALAYEMMEDHKKAARDFQTALEKSDPPLNPLKRERAAIKLMELSSQSGNFVTKIRAVRAWTRSRGRPPTSLR